jgi:hypothetical protein
MLTQGSRAGLDSFAPLAEISPESSGDFKAALLQAEGCRFFVEMMKNDAKVCSYFVYY